MDGFQLLDLHDYLGTGHGVGRLTRRVLGRKRLRHREGVSTIQQHNRSAGPFDKESIQDGRATHRRCRSRAFRRAGRLKSEAIIGRSVDEQRQAVSQLGSFSKRQLPIGKNIPLGRISRPICRKRCGPERSTSCRLHQRASLRTTGISGFILRLDTRRASSPQVLVTNSWPEAKGRTSPRRQGSLFAPQSRISTGLRRRSIGCRFSGTG